MEDYTALIESLVDGVMNNADNEREQAIKNALLASGHDKFSMIIAKELEPDLLSEIATLEDDIEKARLAGAWAHFFGLNIDAVREIRQNINDEPDIMKKSVIDAAWSAGMRLPSATLRQRLSHAAFRRILSFIESGKVYEALVVAGAWLRVSK